MVLVVISPVGRPGRAWLTDVAASSDGVISSVELTLFLIIYSGFFRHKFIVLFVVSFIFDCSQFLRAKMTYSRLVIGDSNIVRFWQAAQLARPQLVGVPLKPVSCHDTLSAALDSITDELDYVIVSVLTSFLIEEGSSVDVRNTCFSVIESVVKGISRAAIKSKRVEVRSFHFCLSLSTDSH